MLFTHQKCYAFRSKTINFDYFFSSNFIRTKLDRNHFLYLPECKSKKMKIATLELKNPYEQIFVRHPVYMSVHFISIKCDKLTTYQMF